VYAVPPSEEAGFAAVAEAHLDDVYAYLAYFTKSRDVAEDLTAATFERALRTWSRFDARRASARTWLCQLARTTALDHFRSEERRRRRESSYVARGRETGEEIFGEGLSPELEDAMRALSAAEREVVALRVVLDLDGRTAARVLGVSETACATRLSRALQKLASALEDDVAA
jgi:RNA polymerase sigma-70 factor (ECF subfamily)